MTPALPWPATGESAVAVAGVGVLGASPTQARVPIASLTKMMTAIVVLEDHPLGAEQTGPLLAFGPDDVVEWKQDLKAGDSAVKVADGETMTERQALEALLLPSADNVADRLALWDAGSLEGFVARMNATAKALGLRNTAYVDPSGLDPGSASDAVDQALVASRLMAFPVARAIVRQPDAALPVAGEVANVNPALGLNGIVGVKSGFTSQAGRCLVTAAYRLDHAALVVSVTLGQPAASVAARVDEVLLGAAGRLIRLAPAVVAGSPFGSLSSPRLGLAIPLVAPALPPAVVSWPGLRRSATITPAVAPDPSRALPAPGAGVAELTLRAPWGALVSMPLRVGAGVSVRPALLASSTAAGTVPT